VNNLREEPTLEDLKITPNEIDRLWRIMDSDMSGFVEIEEMTNILTVYESFLYFKETYDIIAEIYISSEE
jgi:Ca2+-binding EF-hand superfamily protein